MSSADRQYRSSLRSSTSSKSGIEYQAGDELKVLDPSRIVEKVREVRGDPDADKRGLPALDLPGFGEEYGDCGDDLPHFCDGCGEVHEVGRTCRRKECPRCAPAWVVERATAAGAKLEATRRYLYQKRGQSPRFHHLTFSPPEGFAVAHDDPWSAAVEIVKEMCDEIGVDGGVIVPHPYRGAEDDDRGFWSEVLFGDRDWDDVRSRLSHEPHFHVIAVGRFVTGGQYTSRLFDRTGWVYNRITKGGDDSDSNVSLYDEYDLARALTYTLSHAGIGEGDAYRYFGSVANLAAEDHIEDEINAAVRSVAPNTLGLPYRSTSCERRLDEDEQSATASASPPDPRPELAGDGDEDRRCGGRLLPISRAAEHLRDREWVESASNVDQLIELMRGRPPPD